MNHSTFTEETIRQQIQTSIDTKRAILADSRLLDIIAQAVQMVTNTYRNGHKTLIVFGGKICYTWGSKRTDKMDLRRKHYDEKVFKNYCFHNADNCGYIYLRCFE